MRSLVLTGVLGGLGLLVACQAAAQKVEAPKQEAPKAQKAEAPKQEAPKDEKKELSEKEKFELALAKRDKWQKACSNPTQLAPEGIDFETFKKEMLATVKFPEGGVVGKDIKRGEKLFGDPEKGGTSQRGNCYACHCGDPRIIACGNIGPSLRGYGKRVTDPEYTYIKIYNSWAIVPCSAMFRYGYHGILTPDEIADIVAYLHDPNSPINK